jgi:hypothetical protein
VSAHKDSHVVKEGRRPGSERCKVCSWTFPCRERRAGTGLHGVSRRAAALPLLQQAGPGVTGEHARSSTSSIPELRNWDDNATWTSWNVHGVTRAVHYSCRDKVASPADLFRWYGRDSLNRFTTTTRTRRRPHEGREEGKREEEAGARRLRARDVCARRRGPASSRQFKTNDGFYLEPLSGPKAQKAFKKRFKVPMNSQRLFGLRGEVWAAVRAGQEGRPTTKTTALPGVPELTPAQRAAADQRQPRPQRPHCSTSPSCRSRTSPRALFLKATIEAPGRARSRRQGAARRRHPLALRHGVAISAGGATTPKKDIAT